MLEDKRHIQANKNSNLFEILLSIIKFFPNLSINLWKNIKIFLGIKISEKNGESPSNKQLIIEDKKYENDYSTFNEDYNNNSNIYIQVKFQSQIQANKQKLKQLESQNYGKINFDC